MNKLVTIAILLFVIAQSSFAQEDPRPTPQSEIELLRQQLAEQKAQIEKMQQQLDKLTKSAEAEKNVATKANEKPVGSVVSAQDVPKSTPQPESIEAGFGKIKFSGLLQGWFAGGNGGFNDTFRIRRAEMKLTGVINPKVKWTIMIDPAKALSLNNTNATVPGTQVLTNTSVNQAGRILQDAFITYSAYEKLNINAGQFRIPISLEGQLSSAKLETEERTLFVSDRNRGGNLGDIRDLGVMAFGSLNKKFDYQIGIFNGSGENQNDTDRNDQKAVAGRFVVKPVKDLQFGVSGVWGNGQRSDRPRRDRLGGEFMFTNKALTLRSEVMTGKDGPLNRLGYYGLVAYQFSKTLEAVFRFDYFDPDTRLETNSANVAERDFVTGLNYYIDRNHFKLQINYIRKTFNNGITPNRNVILANLQTSW